MVKRFLQVLLGVNWLKTLYFNCKFLPLSQALLLPIFVYWRTKILTPQDGGKGKIVLSGPVRPGIVRIGMHSLSIVDDRYERTLWEQSGVVEFKGVAYINRGCRISVGQGATLTLGDQFIVTGRSTIICKDAISVGNDCLFSWDVILIDSDFHAIYDVHNNRLNPDKPIAIGDHVWIGCRCSVTKGVSIASNNVIASNSVITKSILDENGVVAESVQGQRVLRESVRWQR